MNDNNENNDNNNDNNNNNNNNNKNKPIILAWKICTLNYGIST